MSADNDRHGTRPGANGKRWVRSIGAHRERMHVSDSRRVRGAHTHTHACTHLSSSVHGTVRKTCKGRIKENCFARESSFLFEAARVTTDRNRLGVSLAGVFNREVFESELIYYPVVIEVESL